MGLKFNLPDCLYDGSFGYNLFLMRAMAPPEIALADIYRSIIPFVFVMIITKCVVICVSTDCPVVTQLVFWEMMIA
jgi:TRAP-type mannitol/chloroaromatic compound transport system permease large subunit